jgi:hypothetical protein
MRTSPTQRTLCETPGGIQMPRVGGTIQRPWSETTTITPCTAWISWPRAWWCAGTTWPAG